MATSDIASASTLPGTRSAPPTTQRSRNRELLSELVRRDLKARYRGSNLGILWSLLNPLLYMVVYSLVFGLFLKARIQNPGLGEVPYPVFLLPGLLAFNFFSQGLAAAVNSVLGNGPGQEGRVPNRALDPFGDYGGLRQLPHQPGALGSDHRLLPRPRSAPRCWSCRWRRSSFSPSPWDLECWSRRAMFSFATLSTC